MTTAFFRLVRPAYALLLPLLLGCTLTSREVEPALPDGRLNDSDTLACHINQKSVAASNYTDLGSLLVSLLGVDSRPVTGKLDRSSTLYVRGVFEGNQEAGIKVRVLQLALPAFNGAGTYPLTSPGTYYQEYTPPPTSSGTGTTQTFNLVPATPAQVVITTWDTATRHLQGTFVLTVAAPGTTQNVPVTDGRFDLMVDN